MHHGGGSVVRDYSGYHNDGRLYGGVSWQDGPYGWALSLDGVSGNIQVPDSPSLRITDKVTVELWFNARAISGQLTDKHSVGNQYNIYLASGYLPIFRLHFATLGARSILPTGTLLTDTWYHVVGTYDGAYMREYLNGSLIGTPLAVADTLDPFTGKPFEIGSRGQGTLNFFNGLIGATRIYSRALDATETNRHFESTRSIFGV
jgi:hypothetical protein